MNARLLVVVFLSIIPPEISNNFIPTLSQFQSPFMLDLEVLIVTEADPVTALGKAINSETETVPNIHSLSILGLTNAIQKLWNSHEGKLAHLIFPATTAFFYSTINKISSTYNSVSCINCSITKWNSFYFLFYPNEISWTNISNVMDQLKVNLHEAKLNLPLTSNVFIVFEIYVENNSHSEQEDAATPSDFSPISIWELYTVKDHFVGKKVMDLSFRYPEEFLQTFIKGLEPKVSRRRNFHLVEIVGAAGYELDYIFETEFGDDNETFKSGMAVCMYRDMKDVLNFTEVALPGQWMVENHSESIDWLVLHDKADVAISQSTLTLDPRSDTKHLLNYLMPTSSGRLYVIFVQPPYRDNLNIVLMPFAASMWAALSFFLLVLISATLIISRLELKFGEGQVKPFDDEDIETEGITVTLWALGALCQQGSTTSSNGLPSFSIKVLIWSAYVSGMACCIAYSATIISFLSTTMTPIKHADDLKNSSFKIYGDSDYFASPYLFEGQMNSTGEGNNTLLPKDALVTLQKSASAYLAFQDAYTAAARQMNYSDDILCKKFSHLPFSKIEYKSSMFVKKGSPFAEFFNHRIMVGKERGLNDLYVRGYARHANPNCPAAATKQENSLEMSDLFTPFAIVGGGYVGSLLMISVEYMYRFCGKANSDQIFE